MAATSSDAVVVSESSIASDDPNDVVGSNIDFLNALFAEHLTSDEVSVDALRSYYVDYYLSQMNNGGFSQFVYNSKWKDCVNELIREGMLAMDAVRHLQAFQSGMRLVEGLGSQKLDEYFESDHWDDNPIRDDLNKLNEQFFQVCESEDLLPLNATWLRQLPNLVVLSDSELKQEINRRANAVPDREQRIAEARALEPRYMKLIRLLCDKAGHSLSHVTAGDPTRVHQGTEVTAWHFLTDQGHFHMVEVNDKATMFRGHSTTDVVFELKTSPGMALTPQELNQRKDEWNNWIEEEREDIEKFIAQKSPGAKEVTLDLVTIFEYVLWKKERDEPHENRSS